MSPIRARIGITLGIGMLLLVAACSDTNKNSVPFNSETGKHPATWYVDHRAAYRSDPGQCTTCHGTDLLGGTSGISCFSASFNGMSCHANGPSGHPAGWNVPTAHGAAAKLAPNATAMQGFSTCQACHGVDFAGGTATTCFTCHGVSAPHAFPWQSTSTRKHSTTNPANAAVCGLCHLGARTPPSYVALPPGTPVGCFDNTLCHGQIGHAAGWNSPALHGAAAKASTGFSSCQGCHGDNFAGFSAAPTCLSTAVCHGLTVNAPHAAAPWRAVTSTLTHTTTNVDNATICGYCHEGEPSNGNHPFTTPGPVNCFDGTLCHAAATNLGCIDCHASVQTGTHGTPRDAVTTEFGLAWGHKKTGRGPVTNADCIVCHLEGEFATQARSATYHADGNIDLRDPDGAGETPITNVSGGAFTFTKFATSYAAGSRTSTGHTSNNVDNVLTQKFCLACHDNNGATNTTARTAGGTAFMPWGGVNLGANYTVANGAAAAGGVIDTKTQFATTNTSIHPVLGPRNSDYPINTRLVAPYDNIGTTRVAGAHNLADSVVLNCFDCHNTPTAPLTDRTVVAHGNAVTLRGTIYASGAASTLCTTCHVGYTSAPGTAGVHGAGSAWQTTGSSHDVRIECHGCHGSNPTVARAVRPLGAQDYHGNNALVGGGLWPTINSRPYAFIRGWTGGAYHRPYRSSEFAAGNPTCGAGTCPTSGQVGDGSTRTYGPGGTY